MNVSLIVNKPHHPYFLLEKTTKNYPKIGPFFENCEKGWSYIGKFSTLGRHFINITLKVSKEIAESVHGLRMVSAVTHLKFLSIIGLPFTIASISKAAQNVFKNIKLHDKEGAALAGLSFTVVVLDFIDSAGTIIGAGFALASKIPFEFISVIGLPVSFVVVGLSSLSRSINLIKACLMYNKFKKQVFLKIDNQASNQQIHDVLWKFLDKNLGYDPKITSLMEQIQKMKESPDSTDKDVKALQKKLNRLIDKKREKLKRSAPPDVVAKFDKIFDMLKQNPELSDTQINEIKVDLEVIMSKFKRKIGIDIGNLISNALTIIGLCLVVSGVAAPVALGFFAAALILKISLQIYQDWDKIKAKLFPNPIELKELDISTGEAQF